MYEELVKRLRVHNGWALNDTLDEAAGAIEELQGKIEEFYCLAQDVNRNEIAGHISENNLDTWLYAFQRYAAKIARKPLPEPPEEGGGEDG